MSEILPLPKGYYIERAPSGAFIVDGNTNTTVCTIVLSDTDTWLRIKQFAKEMALTQREKA